MGAVSRDKTVLLDIFPMARAAQIKRLARIDPAPQLAYRFPLAPDQIIDKALEVGGLGNIHGRAAGVRRFSGGTRTIYAGFEKLFQHIILVGREYQLLDRQPHHARNMPGADIAKVAGRHRERNLFIAGFCRGKITLEVIHNLRRHARPIDRVDRADLVFFLERMIVGHGFHHVLRIVKHTLDRDIENIRILQREHLCSLEAAHLLVR